MNKFIVFTLSLIISGTSLAADIHQANNYWNKLLHFDGEHSRVSSVEFFVTTNGANDAMAEQLETIRLLNGSDGAQIACNFPARYQWLKSQGKAIPSFDLMSCTELQNFLNSFQNQTLSIVFISEFTDVPASAFGHVMLAFHNLDVPFSLADTIHFSAITKPDNFFRYAYSGLTGKYDGFYMREPFFVKQNEYNINEQRALYVYELNMSKEEISRITLHLFELRKARFQYFFIKENCAFYVADLLDIAFLSEDHSLNSQHAVLPIDVVRQYQHQIKQRVILSPSLFQAEESLERLTKNELVTVENVIAQHEKPNNLFANSVKEVLALHYQYTFRRQKKVYDNYSDVQALEYIPTPKSKLLKDPLVVNDASQISLGAFQSRKQLGLLLGYGALSRNIYSLQQNDLQESETSILFLQAELTSQSAILKRLDLLKVASSPKSNTLRQDLSWAFYSGVNRENLQVQARPEVEFGMGKSWGGANFTFTALASAGIQASAGAANLYMRPNIAVSGYSSSNTKIGILVSDKLFQSQGYLQSEFFLTYQMTLFNLSGRYLQTPNSAVQTSLVVDFHL
jgi:hypothetical protein